MVGLLTPVFPPQKLIACTNHEWNLKWLILWKTQQKLPPNRL